MNSHAVPQTAEILDRIRTRSTTFANRIKRHPGRSVRVTFCWDTIEEEEDRLEQMLATGRYRVTTDMALAGIHGLAVEALVDRLRDIALTGDIATYEIAHEVIFDTKINEPKLVATVTLPDVHNLQRYQRGLRLAGFKPNEGNDPLFP